MSTSVAAAHSVSSPRRRGVLHYATRLFNPLALLFAGTRFLPLYGVIEHRGRRSGNTFRTPIVVRPTTDGFVIPMPWGTRTDWYRNVRAAGECVVRWNGRDYPVVQPEVVSSAGTGSAFNAFQRAALTRLGIGRCLRLRHRSGTGAS